MQRLLLVGSGFSNITGYLREHGYDYIILKDRNHTKFPDKNIPHRVLCDFSSKQSILNTVDAIGKKIDGVITIYENYIPAASWITDRLGLPGMPEASALACTDKFLMRQAFAKSPIPISPDFAIVRSEDEVLKFADQHQLPLILKPANLVKSLLVTKSDTLDELIENYRATVQVIDQVYQRYAPNRQPTIIVEEFLSGTMHSIAGFADANGTPHLVPKIVDLQTARDIGHKDNFLYNRSLPSKLSAAEQSALLECASAGMQALGMQSSPAHVEIINTVHGPRIVEIGARVGGYRERMYKMCNDISLTKATIDTALGKIPELAPKKHEGCAVLELFPDHAGIFAGIEGADNIRELPSLNYFAIKTDEGAQTGRAADGHKRCAIVILHNSDQAQLAADLQIANQARVKTV